MEKMINKIFTSLFTLKNQLFDCENIDFLILTEDENCTFFW